MESRLTDLEMHLMHQENTVQELNDVVREQQRMIDMLRAEVQAIKDQLQTSINRLSSEEEPPPHY